jgi:hypothetical protein
MKIRVKVVYDSGNTRLISFDSDSEARFFMEKASKEALEVKVLNFYG